MTTSCVQRKFTSLDHAISRFLDDVGTVSDDIHFSTIAIMQFFQGLGGGGRLNESVVYIQFYDRIAKKICLSRHRHNATEVHGSDNEIVKVEQITLLHPKLSYGTQLLKGLNNLSCCYFKAYYLLQTDIVIEAENYKFDLDIHFNLSYLFFKHLTYATVFNSNSFRIIYSPSITTMHTILRGISCI